jgi:hypothetical protein
MVTRAGNDGIDPEDVDMMQLYVFDNNGYYLGEYVDNKVNYLPDYYIDCSDLLPGKYRFIAWSGKDDRFYETAPEVFVKGRTSFGEALLMLKNREDNVISNKLHHLFHSDIAVTVTNAKVQHFVMPLAQETNTINIRTVGLPADVNSYRFEISDNNCFLKFDGFFAQSKSTGKFNNNVKYAMPCTKDYAKQLHSSLVVMRLAANRHTSQLQIINEDDNTVLYPTGSQTGDLVELIKSAYPQNDFDMTHTYDIVIYFDNDGNDLNVTIYVNGWKVYEENSELTE